MNKITHPPLAACRKTSVDRTALQNRMDNLDPDRLALVECFIDQILTCYDPEVIETFMAWQSDPRIGSIMQLAACLGDEDCDQVLFMVEALFSGQLHS